MKQLWFAIHQLPGACEISRGPAFYQIAGQRKRCTSEPDERHARTRQLTPHQSHCFSHMSDVTIGIQRSQLVEIRKSANWLTDYRPDIFYQFEVNANGMQRRHDIRVEDGRIHSQATYRLQRYFSTEVGALGSDQYHEYVEPHVQRIFSELQAFGGDQVPLIHFGTGTSALLEHMAAAGGSVIGLDWHIPLDQGWHRVGGPGVVAIQGNLDPALLLAPWDVIERESAALLQRSGGHPGHIFNLGHGILPATPVEHLERLVDWVHTNSHTDRSMS